jgi:hydroxylamine reductase (hybrid-cluster protein)
MVGRAHPTFFAVEPDPAKAADLIIKHVEGKRRALGLEAR